MATATTPNEPVELRAIGIPQGPTAPAADAERASTRGIYFDLDGRRRVVAAGDVVPDGWRRESTAVLADRIGEVPTNFEDGVTEGGQGGPSASKSRTSRSSSSDDGDEFDKLSGDALAKAASDAGVDTSTGGSRQDGGMKADEVRDALRQKAKSS